MAEFKETLKKIFSKKNLPYFAVGGVVIGAYFFLKRRGPAGIERPGVAIPAPGAGPGLPPEIVPLQIGSVKPPALVKKRELVSAKSYKIVAARTPGMQYAVVTKKNKTTGEITFRSPVAGFFTRNVVQEGSKLWAEIQPAAAVPQVTPQTIAGLGL